MFTPQWMFALPTLQYQIDRHIHVKENIIIKIKSFKRNKNIHCTHCRVGSEYLSHHFYLLHNYLYSMVYDLFLGNKIYRRSHFLSIILFNIISCLRVRSKSNLMKSIIDHLSIRTHNSRKFHQIKSKQIGAVPAT